MGLMRSGACAIFLLVAAVSLMTASLLIGETGSPLVRALESTFVRETSLKPNECGEPCSGPRIESKKVAAEVCKLVKKDCEMTEWQDWSVCTSSADQSFRIRTITQTPENGGHTCKTPMKETRPCGMRIAIQCEISEWQPWTDCSSSCGTGRHTRMRRILNEAVNGGGACTGPLLQTSECFVKKCHSEDCQVSDWGEWSFCSHHIHPQRYRTRHVLRMGIEDGKRCKNSLKETEGCPSALAVDCLLGAWSEWTKCDKACSGGQKFRTRKLQRTNSHGGSCPMSALHSTAPCNQHPCKTTMEDCKMSTWEEWSTCSEKCGNGTKVRTRKVTSLAEVGGSGCEGALTDSAVCQGQECHVIDCVWGDWFEWSACTVSCAGGHHIRKRMIIASPRGGGKPCAVRDKEETGPCNTHPCKSHVCIDGLWSAWSDWTACSATCDDGFERRHRRVQQEANSCGKPAKGLKQEYRSCKHLPVCLPDQNCTLSAWHPWSSCSSSCFGVRERDRHVVVLPTGKGKRCECQAMSAVEPCNSEKGLHAKSGCIPHLPQDCVLTEWTNWTECTRTCGGGQIQRHRHVHTPPANGGKECDPQLVMTKACNVEHCRTWSPCIDCKLGKWSSWGDCTRCGGQRVRTRTIDELANHCGKPCHPDTAMMEISDCSITCTTPIFCAWTDWASPSSCIAECGLGTRTKTRALGYLSDAKDYLFSSTSNYACAGTQTAASVCNTNKKCPECIPQHCVFAAWLDWSEPACTGLCTRTRVIDTLNNDCGRPCGGALEMTKECPIDCTPAARDCAFGAWSEWSSCHAGDTQMVRQRMVEENPAYGGKPCMGPMKETKACGLLVVDSPCRFSDWSAWNECSETCDGGSQTRFRRITTRAAGHGALCDESLEELHTCHTQACPSNKTNCQFGGWGEWSECGVFGSNQRSRARTIAKDSDGGAPCSGHLEEIESCGFDIVDCDISEWTHWDKCGKTCGGGQQHRQRQVHQFPMNGGKNCPVDLMQTRGCNELPCGGQDCEVSDWGDWLPCTAKCGVGQEIRHRTVTKNRMLGGSAARCSCRRRCHVRAIQLATKQTVNGQTGQIGAIAQSAVEVANAQGTGTLLKLQNTMVRYAVSRTLWK